MDGCQAERAPEDAGRAWACLAPHLRPGAPARPEFKLPANLPERASLPVLDWLPALPALAAPDTRRLVDMLVEAASSLTWRRTYGDPLSRSGAHA